MIRLKSENSWYFTKLGLMLTDPHSEQLAGAEIYHFVLGTVGSAYASHFQSPDEKAIKADHAAIFAELANLSLDKVGVLKAQNEQKESYIRHIASKKTVVADSGPDQVKMKLKFDKKGVDI